ncbi:unnamed protein product, partial [Thlaspi arvense]
IAVTLAIVLRLVLENLSKDGVEPLNEETDFLHIRPSPPSDEDLDFDWGQDNQEKRCGSDSKRFLCDQNVRPKIAVDKQYISSALEHQSRLAVLKKGSKILGFLQNLLSTVMVSPFEKLDKVNALYNDGWWVGVVKKVLAKDYPIVEDSLISALSDETANPREECPSIYSDRR